VRCVLSVPMRLRTRTALLTGLAWAAVCGFASGQEGAVVPQKGGVVPQQREPNASPPGQDAIVVPPGGYVRDRRLVEALATLERMVRSGSGQDFATVAQWVLDQPGDSIVINAQGRPVSVRRSVECILSQTSRERLADYRRQIGPTAAAELAEVRREDGSSGLWKIVRRFFLTEAGGQAAVELIVKGLDAGADDVVTALGTRLLREPAHAGVVTPALKRRIEMAAERTQVAAAATFLPSSDPRNETELVSRSAAIMARPNWTVPLEVRRQPTVDTRWRQWMSQVRDADQSTAISFKPLVVQDKVLFRDGSRLRAIDANTGKVVWEQSTNLGWESLLSSTLAAPGEREAIANRRTPLLIDWMVTNSTYFSLTTDGRQVFLVDDAGAALESIIGEKLARDLPEDDRREALRNDVIAISLETPSGADKRAIWSLRERAGGAEGPLQDHTFLGPPAVLSGLLVVLTEVDREVCACAIDPMTGAVRWIQAIAEPDTTILDDRGRFARSCTPVVSRGFVLCPTQMGSLVALDATTGAFAWVHAHFDPRLPAGRPVYRPATALPQLRNAAFNLQH
jgi:outer membrane protein assembly factor BamB